MTLQIYKIASSTVTASAGVASIVFSNIPQGYRDLMLNVSTRTISGFADTSVIFNNSTSNYSSRRLLGTGSAVSSDTQALSQLREEPSSYTASTFSSGQLYIPNYAGSSAKSHSGDSVSENNATAAIQMMTANLWNDTSAITQIEIKNYNSGGNLAQYTTATLYGIL